MKISDVDITAIAAQTATALRKERKDCDDRSGSCLIYTTDKKQVEKHLSDHKFIATVMDWALPTSRQMKSVLIKILVYGLFALIAAAVLLFSPVSIRGLIK